MNNSFITLLLTRWTIEGYFKLLKPVLIFLFGSFLKVTGQSNLRFEHLSVQQGLSQSTVFCAAQDREGFMWFGTADGLNKYDGYNFTVFKPDPHNPGNTLQHNMVSAIHEDRAGRLWVSTLGGGLHEINKRTGKVTPYRIDPRHVNLWNVVLSLYEDQQDVLWLATIYGVARFDPKTKQFTLYPTPDLSQVGDLIQDYSGGFWVLNKGGVSQFDPHINKPLKNPVL